MQKNSFIVLGIDENATISEITNAYETLVAKYKEDRFVEGEIGNTAAKKLAEVEVAYKECMDAVHSRAVFDDVSQIYSKVNDAINQNNIDEAQSKLDNIEYRDAEWHYYQSIIYYKKNWFEESRKQLEVSVALEPNNTKYTQALEKLKNYSQNAANNANQQQQQQRAGYSQPNARQTASNSDACCNTCCTLMCLDSCCECCGGDCISCC